MVEHSQNMIKQITAPIVSNTEIMPHINLLWLHAPEIAAVAQPGQFVMVRCGDNHDPLLRRPISIHRVAGKERIALLFHIVGKGTERLATYRKGDIIDLYGPLGNGFSLLPSSRHMLMIAGGIGIAPLIFLAERALKTGCSVKLLLGAQQASLLYPGNLLPASMDIFTATDDGSAGKKGLVTEFMNDFVHQADQVFACGPAAMYKSIADQKCVIDKPVQISLEARMGCGLGACYSCTVKAKQGLKQVCQDGPVFDLKDIL